ncbi:growth arrest-specific protein 1a [Salminus brasiliensis]|uniref:growth arrest-specific protein 1a n=1 Tax=Salminus brasiliensis TaxID=930266 RepID=UPI003B83228A
MARAPVAAACVLVCLGACAVAVVECAARRLICWEAILNCQAEAECNYAYGQYVHACEPVLSGRRSSCPSHCIASLVQLNLTRGGPALEECSCASDPVCRDAKRAIEPCMPRTSSLGCTEARRQCDRDPQCRTAMANYLLHCGKLFSGAVCTSACREVIADMRRLPKAQLLDTCVCDGTERTICEYIKLKMKNLCFGELPVADYDDEGSGNEDDDEDDYDNCPPDRKSASSASTWGASVGLVLLVESVLVLVQALS